MVLEDAALERSLLNATYFKKCNNQYLLFKRNIRVLKDKLINYHYLQICQHASKVNISMQKSAAVFQCSYLLAKKATRLEKLFIAGWECKSHGLE